MSRKQVTNYRVAYDKTGNRLVRIAKSMLNIDQKLSEPLYSEIDPEAAQPPYYECPNAFVKLSDHAYALPYITMKEYHRQFRESIKARNTYE